MLLPMKSISCKNSMARMHGEALFLMLLLLVMKEGALDLAEEDWIGDSKGFS